MPYNKPADRRKSLCPESGGLASRLASLSPRFHPLPRVAKSELAYLALKLKSDLHPPWKRVVWYLAFSI